MTTLKDIFTDNYLTETIKDVIDNTSKKDILKNGDRDIDFAQFPDLTFENLSKVIEECIEEYESDPENEGAAWDFRMSINDGNRDDDFLTPQECWKSLEDKNGGIDKELKADAEMYWNCPWENRAESADCGFFIENMKIIKYSNYGEYKRFVKKYGIDSFFVGDF